MKLSNSMPLSAINYDKGKLSILNQLLLPQETVYENIETVEDGWNAINKMKVSYYLLSLIYTEFLKNM